MPAGGYMAAASICTLIWSDFYPAPELEFAFKGKAFVEVKVEDCEHWRGHKIQVSNRYYYEFFDKGKLVQEEIKGWDEIKLTDEKGNRRMHVIEPFKMQNGKPVPP